MTPTTAERIAASKLRPGHQIILYGGPVYVTGVEGRPAHQPMTSVEITYRKDFAEGHIIGRTTMPAGVTFELYDDGEPF